MFLTRSLIVGLLVIMAVLVVPGFQALANHRADVLVKIFYVKIVGKNDANIFAVPLGSAVSSLAKSACSDPYVYVYAESQVNFQFTGTSTETNWNVCPGKKVFVNRWISPPTGLQEVNTGNYLLSLTVYDEDGSQPDDQMLKASAGVNPCDDTWRTLYKPADTFAGETATLYFKHKCRPKPHMTGASELVAVPAGTRTSDTARVEVFNTRGQKVLEVMETGAALQSLTAAAQNSLANGVYLYIATLNDSQGQVSQKLGKIAVVRGRVSSVSSNEESTIPTSSAPPPLKRQRITCNGLKPTIIGTSGNDTIIGTEGKDVIAGLGGNDWIHGLGGDDIICGGSGNDLIVGGAGNDTILGGAGHDTIDGSEGDDNLHGNDGVDQMTGGVGNDLLRGGAGDDLLLGDAGYDYLNGGSGKDSLDGGSDLDTCVYGEQTFNCP
jgi:Ca2+-binding RTX toxin-like protein